jgi:hypothetical protein
MDTSKKDKEFPRVCLVFTGCSDVEVGDVKFRGDFDSAGVRADDCDGFRAKDISFERPFVIAEQVRQAIPSLPQDVAEIISGPLSELETAAKAKNPSKAETAISTIRAILQGAGGNLVASGLLAAIGMN